MNCVNYLWANWIYFDTFKESSFFNTLAVGWKGRVFTYDGMWEERVKYIFSNN